MSSIFAALVLAICYMTVAGDLTCRRCTNAANLDDCTSNVKCSAQESCYMDQVITEQYTIEFRAGCRAKDVCSVGGQTPLGKRSIQKRSELIACSRCCDREDPKGCNSKLCGIKPGNGTKSQCYFCDHTAHSDQGDVKEPSDCITLTTCQSDEVCYAQQAVLGTTSTWTYGCFQRRMCEILMPNVLEDMRRCYIDKDRDACGFAKRSQIVCSICCADGSCNSGTCEDIKIQLYNLYVNGMYNTTTMKTINGGHPLSTLIPPQHPISTHPTTSAGP